VAYWKDSLIFRYERNEMAMSRFAENRFFATIQSESRQILFMACLAIAVRVIWAVVIPTFPLSDSHAYDVFAQNIVEHGVYGWKADEPSAYWPVGTSAIYALLFGIFGHVYWPIVILNIVLSVAIIATTMRIARRLYPGYPIIAGIAGALLAFWPSLIMYVTVLASELPFIAAVMIAIDAWTGRDKSMLWRGLIAGFFFAVASYVRPTALLLPLVLGLQLLVTRDSVRRALTMTAVTYLTMAVLIAPWTARNYGLFGAFVPISTNGGANLWMGNHLGSAGTYTKPPEYVDGLDEYTRNKVLGQEAVAYIKSDIPVFLIGSLKRLWATHNRETIAIAWNESGIERALGPSAKLPLKLLATSYWLVLLLLALAGIVLRFRASTSILNFASDPILLLWVYFATTHAIIVASDRYHFPSIPAVAIFAAITFHSRLQRLRG
jgi:hypothetical protein